MNIIIKDSLSFGAYFLTIVCTVSSLSGFSMLDLCPFSEMSFIKATFFRLLLIIAFYLLIVLITGVVLFFVFCKREIKMMINGMSVTIKRGDIFKEDAMRVIPVDTCFQTTVDDTIIAKNTLHGQLVLQHGNVDNIKNAVRMKAKREGIKKGTDGNYPFKTGTAIRYDGTDGRYIMVALIKLDANNEAHTNTAQFEITLINIWKAINRVYAQNPVALPVFGSGIARFDDAHYSTEQLVVFMLLMLKKSKAQIKSKITIILHSKDEVETILSLREHKRFFELLR